jgi:hypothetical protein
LTVSAAAVIAITIVVGLVIAAFSAVKIIRPNELLVEHFKRFVQRIRCLGLELGQDGRGRLSCRREPLLSGYISKIPAVHARDNFTGRCAVLTWSLLNRSLASCVCCKNVDATPASRVDVFSAAALATASSCACMAATLAFVAAEYSTSYLDMLNYVAYHVTICTIQWTSLISSPGHSQPASQPAPHSLGQRMA